MKSRTLPLLGGIILLVLLSTPIRPAAQEQRQQAERAGHPDTGTSNPMPLINQPLVPDVAAPAAQETSPTYAVLYSFTSGVDGPAPAGAQIGPSCNGICSSVFVSPISLYGGDAAGLAVDSKGDLYVAENVNNWGIRPQGPFVLKVGPNRPQTAIKTSGGGWSVSALTLDKQGNLYIADGNGYGGGQPRPLNKVWKMTPDGSFTTFALVNDPSGLAFGPDGNLYVSSWSDGAVYEFSPQGQLLGIPLSGLGAQDLPYGVAVDQAGNLYVAGAGPGGSLIYKVTPSGTASVFVDAAPLQTPSSLVFDAAGNLYAGYYDGLKILRIAPDGSYVIFPGGGVADDAPNGLAVSDDGALFVSVNGGRTTEFPALVKVGGGIVPANK